MEPLNNKTYEHIPNADMSDILLTTNSMSDDSSTTGLAQKPKIVIPSFLTLLGFLAFLGASVYFLITQMRSSVPPIFEEFEFDTFPVTSKSDDSPRVVLLLVDGLRLDEAKRMDFKFGDHVLFESSALTPTISIPNWITLLSGASPDLHGVRGNDADEPIKIDNLLTAATRSSKRAAIIGDGYWSFLLRSVVEPYNDGSIFHSIIKEDPEAASIRHHSLSKLDLQISTTLSDNLSHHDYDFIAAYLANVDATSHAWGTRSSDYIKAIKETNDRINNILFAAHNNSSRPTVFVITADHGHISFGGHGGQEHSVRSTPLIFLRSHGNWSTKLKSAARDFKFSALNVAPTVAALSGFSIPSFCEGSFIEEVAQEFWDENYLTSIREISRQQQLWLTSQLRKYAGLQFDEDSKATSISDLKLLQQEAKHHVISSEVMFRFFFSAAFVLPILFGFFSFYYRSIYFSTIDSEILPKPSHGMLLQFIGLCCFSGTVLLLSGYSLSLSFLSIKMFQCDEWTVSFSLFNSAHDAILVMIILVSSGILSLLITYGSLHVLFRSVKRLRPYQEYMQIPLAATSTSLISCTLLFIISQSAFCLLIACLRPSSSSFLTAALWRFQFISLLMMFFFSGSFLTLIGFKCFYLYRDRARSRSSSQDMSEKLLL